MSSRFVIGIDLGTTNCVLAYVDSRQPQQGAKVVPVPQWETPIQIVETDALPSFHYLIPPSERQSGFTAEHGAPLPVDGWIPGRLARQQMAFHPGRVIHSAKSWLCHMEVERTAPILPWKSDEVPSGERLSPVQASAAYLSYLKQIWEKGPGQHYPGAEFNTQDVVITVPASFDEAAQELTLEAARLAGYPNNVRLIEEPQAAFYYWLGKGKNLSLLLDLLDRHSDRPAKVLVCDIGGGTTDFSLFEVAADRATQSGLSLKRVAVSDHILLGGDNIDLSLAMLLERKLGSDKQRLTGREMSQLLVQARDLKERILGGEEGRPVPDDQVFSVSLAGSGSGLFASARSLQISAGDVRQFILEGFFPLCNAADRPRQSATGLKEWGLPFASDSAVTRQLAGFLEGQDVDAVLFNGGTVIPLFLRQRLTDLITSWQDRSPLVLTNEALSLAVARGAARFGHILRSPASGQRIAGGHAHSLYLEVSKGKDLKKPLLVCILPQGMEAEERVTLADSSFDLLVNQPVRFQCYYSNRRPRDKAGEVVSWNDKDFHSLPALQTAIHLPPERPKPPNNRLRVSLESCLNELGLLQIFCVDAHNGRWRLDFNLRRGTAAENEQVVSGQALVDSRLLQAGGDCLRSLFAKKKNPEWPDIKPRQIMRQLEQAMGGDRDSWDSLTLRSLWPILGEGMTRKSRSVDHEVAWLQLAGYSLRPGYGVELDDTRIEELWRVFDQGMSFPNESRVQVQWAILWRRVAGGLNHRRQERVYRKFAGQLQNIAKAAQEHILLAGALERLAGEEKIELVKLFGAALVKRKCKHNDPLVWSLGRLLNRTPLYAGPETILPPAQVSACFQQLRNLDWTLPEYRGLNQLFSQAARRTEQRGIDVDSQLREEILEKMRSSEAPGELLRVVRDVIPVEEADRLQLFGESLPRGLILVQNK